MQDLERRVALGQEAGLLAGLHALVIRQGDTPLLDYFSPGEDWAWMHDLGWVEHGPDTLHDLRSVTKSLVSLVYGIALEQGLVPPPDTPLSAVFPDYHDLFADDAARAMRVEHALNMTLGLAWREADLDYSNPKNSEIEMEHAEDRYRYILSQPRQSAPGAEFIYCGGATALVGHLIKTGSGMSLADFTSKVLLAPLGISSFEWHAGQDGVHSAASGLRLAAPDLAKIGQLLLQRGQWHGASVVPADWLAKLETPVTETIFGAGYAYGWYIQRDFVPATGRVEPVLAAYGNGGQRLFVIPSMNLTAVVLSGRYNAHDQWLTPLIVLKRLILGDLPPG